ncbi:MAG: hypothetical protein WBQ40_14905 [Candidatus Sulfotelmatobacter sp.]
MSSLADLFVNAGELSETSQELEKSFFDCLRVKNGVYKTTYSHRLDDLNAEVANYLPSARPLQLLDVAISSGVSTLEWVESLGEAGLDYHMTGIDLTIGALLVSFGDRLHAVLDHAKWPLLFEIDGQWVSNPPRKKHLYRHFFSLAVIRSALFLWAQRYPKSNGVRLHRVLGMPTSTRAINLVTPRLMNHPRVTIGEGNILAESWQQGTFHVIRAANILNRSYFDNHALSKILHNLRRHLIPDGILVVCNTDTDEEAVNHATILALREDQQFEVLSRMNGGSEIEHLILHLSNKAI